MAGKQKWTLESCMLRAKPYSTRRAFSLGDSGAYRAACRYNWVEQVCAHMEVLQKKHTLESCALLAKPYTTRKAFQVADARTYQAALKCGWLNQICSHMVPGKKGWSRTEWGRGKIKGLLYILRCFNDQETFIKVGITRNSIKNRYSGKIAMPYTFTVLHTVEGEPEEIYDLENILHRQLKEFSYTPKLYFYGQTECFTMEAWESLKDS